jgi:hypothetical protein
LLEQEASPVMTRRFLAGRASLAAVVCSVLVLASGPAHAQKDEEEKVGGCFSPLIAPATPVVYAGVGEVVRFEAINNLPGCPCGGSVTTEVTVPSLDYSDGLQANITNHPAAPNLAKLVDLRVQPYGPPDIPVQICIQASRPYGGTGCDSWTSERYCEWRTIHVTQARVNGDLAPSVPEVIVPPNQLGSVTLSWWTSDTSFAEMKVQVDGVHTSLSTALNGQYTYSQLRPGKTYWFQLYANGIFLVQRPVTARMGPSGTLTATPTTVVAPAGTAGTTTLRWTTQNTSNAELKVSVNGQAPTLVARARNGQQSVSWIVAGDTYLFTLHPTDPPGPPVASVTVRGVLPRPPMPDAGHWYNPGRSGNGIDLQPAGSDTVVLTWYTYTASGEPIWYMAYLTPETGAWAGELYESSWNGTSASARAVGTAKLLSSGGWRYQWTMGSLSGEEPIEPLAFGGGATTMNLSGNWYNAAESGWGILFTSRGTTHLANLTIYSGSRPTWLQGVANTSGTSLVFPLSYVTGLNLCPGCTGTPSIVVQAAGTLTVTGSSGAPSTATASSQVSFPGGSWNRAPFTLTRLSGP